MRIAFLTTEYPTEKNFAGGLASYLRRTCYALAELGHEMEVFCLSDIEGHSYDKKIIIHRVRINRDLLQKFGKLKLIGRFKGVFEIWLVTLKLFLVFKCRHASQPFDIVQSSNYRACGILTAVFGRVPIVTRISSFEPLRRDGYKIKLTAAQKMIEKLEVYQLKFSSAVYAPSKMVADIISKRGGFPVALIEPPVSIKHDFSEDDGPLGISLPEKYGLFFGSIGRLKGCDRLLEILPSLFTENPDMGFLFIGKAMSNNGKSFDLLVKETLSEFQDQVFVLPPLKHEKLFPIVKRARFVVLPSRTDNLPNTCLEAMALGRVVIGTHGASFDQLIKHGENGFLVSQEDNENLRKTINLVWRMSDHEREDIGSKAKEILNHLDSKNTIEKLIAFYNKIISETKYGLV